MLRRSRAGRAVVGSNRARERFGRIGALGVFAEHRQLVAAVYKPGRRSGGTPVHRCRLALPVVRGSRGFMAVCYGGSVAGRIARSAEFACGTRNVVAGGIA